MRRINKLAERFRNTKKNLEQYIEKKDLTDIMAKRPSKCQNVYTTTIFVEKYVRQKVGDFCPNLNRDKLMYSLKYTFTVQFVIKDCSYIVTIY